VEPFFHAPYTSSRSGAQRIAVIYPVAWPLYRLSCTVRVRVRVRVTLQLTVSQSVRLGVEPDLGLLT
jgi:hypothetical protein